MSPTKAIYTIDPYRLWDSRPTFSHEATSTGPCRIVATAGQVGADHTGTVPTDIDEQIGLAMANLRRCLEAVGGKIWSVDPLQQDKVVDVVAAWINDTNQAQVYALVRSLGLELMVQNTVGDVIQEDLDGGLGLFKYGGTPAQMAEENGVEQLVYIRDLAEVCQQLDIHDPVGSGGRLDSMTLEDWCRAEVQSETALASVKLWTRAMLGLEPSEMSALYFLNYCKSGGGLLLMRSDFKHGGQYLRFTKGTQSLSLGLADRLAAGSVVLSSPVRRIEQTPDGIFVAAGRGEFQCQRVIVSVSTVLYHEIAFEPPLPSAKVELGKHNVHGYTMKVMVLYSAPWWRTAVLSDAAMSFVGPTTTCRDSSNDAKGQYSLTCFTNGDFGRKMSLLPQRERFAAILAHVTKLYGPYVGGAVPAPVAIVEHEWFTDQWAQGCPCPASPPGIMTKYHHALRTTHGKVHFVGTETAYEWKGYMEGAVRSGERGAKEVIEALRRAKL